MKKIWIAVVAVLILGIGAVLFMPGKKNGPAATAEVAAYVPANILWLSSLDNLNAHIDSFGKSPLGRFFAKETVHAILSEMQAKPEEIQAYDQWYDNIVSTVNNPLFRTVFGDDLSLALLPPDARLLKEDPQQALKGSPLIYATTNIATAVELFGKMAKGVKIGKEQAGNLELTRIELDGGKTVIYGYDAKGVVLLALDKAAISAGLQAKESGTSLVEHPVYKEANAFWREMATGEPLGRSYVNIGAFTALLRQMEPDEEAQEVIDYLDGLEHGYAVSSITPQGLYGTGRVKIQYEQLHALVKGMVDGAEAGPAPVPLSLMSEKTLYFDWGRSLRPEAILEIMAAQDPQLLDSATQEEIKNTLGISLQEALSSFGPIYGLVLNDIVETGIFPLPDMTIFANVRNRDHIKTLATVADRQISTIYGLNGEQQQLEGNTQLYSWPLMTEVGLVPGLGLNDDFVFIGSMEPTLQTLLANSQAKDSKALPDSLAAQLGPEMGKKIGSANGGVSLLRPAQLIPKLQPSLGTLNSLLSSPSGKNYSRLIQEITKLMQSVELMATAYSVSKEGFDSDSLIITVPATDTSAQ